MGQIREFWLGESILLWTLTSGPENFPLWFFTHFGRPTAENYGSVFSTGVWPNAAFDRRETKTWVRSFRGATMGQIFKILTRRDFGPLHQWSRKFPPGVFTHFGNHMAKNYEAFFLTIVWPNGAFDWCATKTCVRSFWLVVRLFSYLSTFDQWCD